MAEADGYVPTLLDAAAFPDDVTRWAARVTPGSAVVTPLVAAASGGLSYPGRVDAIAAIEKQVAWLQAQQLRLLAEVAVSGPDVEGESTDLSKQWAREDVACALRITPGTAIDRLALARELTRLPATSAALARGELTLFHARALAEATRPFPVAKASAIEAAVLPSASGESVHRFRQRVERAVLSVDDRDADEQHAEAMTQRRVAIRPTKHGMSELFAVLPAEGAAALGAVLDAAALRRAGADDGRSADQRRADALVDLAAGALGSGSREQGLRPAVRVTVALSTLLGLDERAGELEGHGPVPAAVARRLAADPTGTWRRLVTDECGRLLDYGRATYRPPRDLAETVIARDVTCRFPHCTRRARRCDLDHRVPYDDGGSTSRANLSALCPRHHHLKHEGGWVLSGDPDGELVWRSPSGREYATGPAEHPVDRTLTATLTATGTGTAPPGDPPLDDPPPF